LSGKSEQTTHNFAPTKTPVDMIAFESDDLIQIQTKGTTTSSGSPFRMWRFSISIYELPKFFQSPKFIDAYLDGKTEQPPHIFAPTKKPVDMIAFESDDLIHEHADGTSTSSGSPFQMWRFSISIYELPEFFQSPKFIEAYLDGKSEQNT
jgi:hypothetical protein